MEVRNRKNVMEDIMRLRKFEFLLLSLFFIYHSTANGTFTLADVIAATEGIANQKPSRRIAPITGGVIEINKDQYQVRFFAFQFRAKDHQNIEDVRAKLPSFSEFAKENNLLNKGPEHSKATIPPEHPRQSLYPTDSFFGNIQTEKGHFHYHLVLGNTQDDNL